MEEFAQNKMQVFGSSAQNVAVICFSACLICIRFVALILPLYQYYSGC